jgi:hypothetical protein|tara:strand:- start:1330 stop:3678 length:2349 start_codon:yes stop_codon:yes gene_type:complete
MAVEKGVTLPLGEVDEIPPFAEEDIEIELEDDGSAVVDFMPEEQTPETGFQDNLAEYLDEISLGKLSSDLIGLYEEDKESRSEWYNAFAKGLDLLGIKQEERTQPFEGASGVNHPLLSEAVTQFQSQAYKELLPAGGPVTVQTIGDDNEEVTKQAQRVKEFMNYQITHVMEEYDPEMDSLLFYLPLSGSAFKKIYFDTMLNRAVSHFVKAEDFIVSYATTDLFNSPRHTHVMTMTENDLRKMQMNGMYLEMQMTGAGVPEENQVKEKIDRIDGVTPNYAENNDMYTLLEMHVDLTLLEIEDHGFACPYIVTICKDTNKILSIRRNWEEGDELYNKVDYFVQYKFLPGLGFYGFGLIHMIGGLTKSVTSILRQLIDAGTLANLPAGFKARGMRIQGENEPIQPGEFRDVDVAGATIRDSLMPLPYKEPSTVLAQLLGVLVDSGRRFASITDMQMGDMGSQEMPVGTTVAMLERGTKVMSAIHKRLHFAQKKEFRLLGKLYSKYLPEQYPYAMPGGQNVIMAQDFDERIDVLPVSDPNIFSMAQRVMIAQQMLQMAQAAPEIHNLPEAYKRMYNALEIKNVESLFQQQQEVPPRDPISEEQAALLGQPIKAFEWQDHEAYVAAHSSFIQNPMVQQQPQVAQMISANIQEHQAMLYKQQVEQAMGQPLPPLEQMTPEIMNQIAQAAAQATAEVTGKAQAVQEAVELQRIDPVIEVQREEIAQRAQKDATQAQLDAEKIISNEAIAEMKIAADREKTLIQAKQEADRTFADNLKQVREADTKSRGE